MVRVLFVCTGNTCRSPMAEAIARAKLSASVPVEVSSAGLAAAPGANASRHAQFVVEDRGGDLGAHRSRLLDDRVLEEADLVLTMTASHRDAIRASWPQRGSDVFTLGEFADEPTAEIDDPFGGTLEDYERAYEQIEALVEAALPRMVEYGARSSDRE